MLLIKLSRPENTIFFDFTFIFFYTPNIANAENIMHFFVSVVLQKQSHNTQS